MHLPGWGAEINPGCGKDLGESRAGRARTSPSKGGGRSSEAVGGRLVGGSSSVHSCCQFIGGSSFLPRKLEQKHNEFLLSTRESKRSSIAIKHSDLLHVRLCCGRHRKFSWCRIPKECKRVRRQEFPIKLALQPTVRDLKETSICWFSVVRVFAC